jgi:thioesterase domain-containing protein/acyl carrier protein/NAD(P)-dependent dehydrogenase (short-subunit alcohol dehydrogenase family)
LELASQASIRDLAIDQIFGEFFNSDSELFVAYRNGQRWVRTYEPVQLERATTDRAALRAGGVYVITGGLGNIGYEISKYLAKNYQAKLILVGRTELPRRKLWDTWIDNRSADNSIADKIKKLREIENLGGDVLYLTANVHDIESMRGALHQAQQRFGNLHGAIHAAGITGEQRFREIKDIDLDHGNAYFQVKAQALLVLEDLLQDKKLDFVLLVSSLTSVLGGIGHAAYTSSCIYLDSFAQERGRDLIAPWLSVNWDFWRTMDRTEAKSRFGKTTRELGMSPDEAMQVLETTLSARRANQLIVSTGDLKARINQWVKLESLRTGRDSTKPSPIRSTFGQRPGPLKDYDEPQNETEQRIAAIWQQAFGFDQIGIHDDFSDLGGHSLLAIKIVSELRKTFQIDLPIRALFEAPTVAELSSYIETHRGSKNQTCVPNDGATDVPGLEDLRARMQKKSPELLVEDAFFVPNWFIQQATWLEDPSNSDSAVYNYPLLLRIRGPLNQTALEQSLAEIVRRHQVFRSIFRMCDGELVQIILPPKKQDLPLTDLSGLPEAERDARFQKIALEEANRPFDLAHGPLLRLGLTRFTNDDHFLQLTTHHIVYDDWSTGILARELSEHYQFFATGRARLLPDLTFHYSDYVRWQQKQRREGKLDSKLQYWKRQLSSAKAFHHLPTDFVRPQKSAKQGARETAVLPSDLADAIKGLSRRERVSLFMVMLAGFQCLLHRYSKDEEIGIASCGANRALADVEPLIGRFGNAMLLRTSFSGNPTLRDLLARVRETALTAYSGQDLPFGMLLKETASAADRNWIPPFQVMFILQKASQDDPQVSGLPMNWHQFFAGTAAYDLEVWLKSEPAVEIILEYRTDLFRAATMKQILNDYHIILETMANDLSTRISEVRLSRQREDLSTPIVSGARKIMVGEHSTTPRNDAELQLIAIWEAALKTRPIDIDENFFELGGDSLLAARLFAQMEKAFQTDLPLAMLLEAPTIRQLAKTINERKIHPSHSSLVTIQAGGTKPPLFCVHGHMGEVFFCRNLSRSLGSDQPVLGLRSQGLRGENPHDSVEDMAIHYLREIRTRQRNGPYFLCGYCFGGMVAYEIARLLEIEGEQVALLVLFNAPAPGGLEGWPLKWVYLSKRIAHELKKLRPLRMRQKLATIVSKAAGLVSLVSGVFKIALCWAVPGLANRAVQRLLTIADINVAAAKSYNPAAYSGRITLFLTEEVASLYATDPAKGWENLAHGGIEIHQVAGDNNSMFDARFVDALTEKLKPCIARASAHSSVYDRIPSRHLGDRSSKLVPT